MDKNILCPEIIEKRHINIKFLRSYSLKYYNAIDIEIKENIFELYLKCEFPEKIYVSS